VFKCVVVCLFLIMMRCGVSGLCVCVVVCLFLNMIRCGMSGLCVCCAVFVPDYDEVWSVWLVCVLWCVCS
jgi:hypothetical protein